jgi:hypothetical protein
MGAGCYYHHNQTKTKAAWIELNLSEDEFESSNDLDFIMEDLEQILSDNGWEKKSSRSNCEYHNGLYELFLESTYYGEGLVIRIEPKDDKYTFGLAMANHSKSENKILRAIAKSGYKLRIATSGYTSTELVFD